MDNNESKILKTAILNEIEGEKFYKKAAQEANNQEASQAFLAMAADERQHQEMLREMLSHLIAGTQMDLAKLNLKGIPSPQIFPARPGKETEKAMEISAFHIAIMMEKASIDYYRQAAAQTGLPETKELYLSLADWEVTHLDSMEKIYDALTEDWWDRQSFSPS